jgi:hypothetical protein
MEFLDNTWPREKGDRLAEFIGILRRDSYHYREQLLVWTKS